MSPPSPATAGRTRVSSSSLIWATISSSSGAISSARSSPRVALDHRATGDEMLHDRRRAPAASAPARRSSSVLVTVMKSPPRKTRATPGRANSALGQRAALGGGGRGEIGSAVAHDVAAGQELQGGGIGRAFGLDEHVAGLLLVQRETGPRRSGRCALHRRNPGG